MALSDVYGQRPWAPSQDLLQQQNQVAGNLPALHQQGMAIRAQESEAARQARPLTPWQKAVMRLQNGEDPKVVAMDTKAELGQGGAAPQGAPGTPPGMPPGVQGGPQSSVIGAGRGFVGGQAGGLMATAANPQAPMPQQPQQNRTPLAASTAFVAARNPPMQQPQSPSTAQYNPDGVQMFGRDISPGMDNRDFQDYTASMKPVLGQREQRDRLAEIRLQNEGKGNVATIGATSRENVADTNAKARAEIEADRNKLKSERLEFDKGKQKDLVEYREEYLAVLKARQSTYDKYTKSKVPLDQAFKALLDASNIANRGATAVLSQPLNNLTEQGRAAAQAKKEEADQKHKELMEYIKAHPQTQSTNESGKSGGSGVAAPVGAGIPAPAGAAPRKTVKMKFPNGKTVPVPEADVQKAIDTYKGVVVENDPGTPPIPQR